MYHLTRASCARNMALQKRIHVATYVHHDVMVLVSQSSRPATRAEAAKIRSSEPTVPRVRVIDAAAVCKNRCPLGCLCSRRVLQVRWTGIGHGGQTHVCGQHPEVLAVKFGTLSETSMLVIWAWEIPRSRLMLGDENGIGSVLHICCSAECQLRPCRHNEAVSSQWAIKDAIITECTALTCLRWELCMRSNCGWVLCLPAGRGSRAAVAKTERPR